MRVLDLTGRAVDQFIGHEVYTEPDGGGFNIVTVGWLLTTVPYAQALDQLRDWSELLTEGGEIHLFAPSLEWASREVRGQRVTVPLMMHLYGDEEHPRRSAYTLPVLRDLLVRAGLMVWQAETLPYPIAQDEAGEVYEGDRHYVIGKKYAHPIDPPIIEFPEVGGE